jgi:transposase
MTVSGGKGGGSGVLRRAPRRRWSEAEKRRIVAESAAPGSSVSMVARRHDLNANMLFTWRREFRRQEHGARGDPVTFVPAMIMPGVLGAGQAPPTLQDQRTGGEVGTARQAPGSMEIVLVGGRRIILGEDVSASALARVIGVLERR